jgi:hypothetical protein
VWGWQANIIRDHGPLERAERENFHVKKKMLLLGSLGAMLLSAALLVVPANAAIGSHCTHCTAIDSNGVSVTAVCHVRPVDACFCPLSGRIIQNNCFFIGGAQPK